MLDTKTSFFHSIVGGARGETGVAAPCVFALAPWLPRGKIIFVRQ